MSFCLHCGASSLCYTVTTAGPKKQARIPSK